MRSLTQKLTLLVLSVSLISVMLVALFARWVTVSAFDTFLAEQERAGFVARLADYYRENGSWQGVMRSLPPPPPPRRPTGAEVQNRPSAATNGAYALLDQQGCVVVPAGNFRLGDCAVALTGVPWEPVLVDGTPVGTVLVNRQQPRLTTAEERSYLQRINWATLLGALGASGLALLLGSVTACSLTRPLRALTRALRAVADGNWQQMVPVTSGDELGELSLAFNQMSSDLVRANRSQRQMTADIAHELRNPLLVMIGYIEAMRDQILKPTPERLTAVYDEAQYLNRLVADLRTLALADAGELALQVETVSPNELLQGVQQAYQAEAMQKQIAISVLATDQLPAIQADPDCIAQVLKNLVSNALRHTPGGGRIELIGRTDAHKVILSVSDTGEGIPAEALPHIFDRLYRADPARQQNGQESGLGLAIAKSIITAHGGEIAVSSRIGAGTTFTIRLPIYSA